MALILQTVYHAMNEHTSNNGDGKRAPWGSKRGWKTRSAKFSPGERSAITRMASDLNSCVDAVIHEAVLLHLHRCGYPPTETA